MKVALAIVAAVALCGAAQAGARKPDWRAFADCAAAYQANARIADPDRPASMTAQISEVADDYLAAAAKRRRQQLKGTAEAARQAVEAYAAERSAAFAAQPRKQAERFIEACPQVDPA
jgi:hypothetical protein